MNTGHGIRRILVALDSARHSLAMMESVANLAAALQAELDALYVEDENLLRLASLPFARELCASSGRLEAMTRERTERELRALAREAERSFTSTMARLSVTARFRVTRGRVASELLSAAGESDLVLVNRQAGPADLGATAVALASRSPRPLLLWQGAPLRPPVCLVYEATAAAGRAAAVAAQLAGALGGGVDLVSMVTPAPDVIERIEGGGIPLRRMQVPSGLAPAARASWVAKLAPGVLVLEAAGTTACALVARSRLPLVLVGEPGH